MHATFFSWALDAVSPSTLFVTGSGLVVVGTVVRWQLQEMLMRAEEHAKDGRLDEHQVRRRVALARYGGPALILVGLATLVTVVWM